MAQTSVVSVRLTRDELKVLRTVPGASDGARLRSLIHARALADAVSEKVSTAVASDGEKTRVLIVEFSRRLQVWADSFRGGAK